MGLPARHAGPSNMHTGGISADSQKIQYTATGELANRIAGPSVLHAHISRVIGIIIHCIQNIVIDM